MKFFEIKDGHLCRPVIPPESNLTTNGYIYGFEIKNFWENIEAKLELDWEAVNEN